MSPNLGYRVPPTPPGSEVSYAPTQNKADSNNILVVIRYPTMVNQKASNSYAKAYLSDSLESNYGSILAYYESSAPPPPPLHW